MTSARLLRIDEVSEMTGLSKTCIRNYVRGAYMVGGQWVERVVEPKFPRPVKYGKQNRFREKEVERWLKAVGA